MLSALSRKLYQQQKAKYNPMFLLNYFFSYGCPADPAQTPLPAKTRANSLRAAFKGRARAWLVTIGALTTCFSAQAAPPPKPLAQQPGIELLAGPHRIAAEVAVTSEALLTGLMWRRKLAPNAGMLFVFPPHIRRCMIMRNTYIPLSVAFLDVQGKILQINNMLPLTGQEHCADARAEYALEMNQGWFVRHSVKPGTAIHGVEKARAEH
jgi:hypothetical protein